MVQSSPSLSLFNPNLKSRRFSATRGSDARFHCTRSSNTLPSICSSSFGPSSWANILKRYGRPFRSRNISLFPSSFSWLALALALPSSLVAFYRAFRAPLLLLCSCSLHRWLLQWWRLSHLVSHVVRHAFVPSPRLNAPRSLSHSHVRSRTGVLRYMISFIQRGRLQQCQLAVYWRLTHELEQFPWIFSPP